MADIHFAGFTIGGLGSPPCPFCGTEPRLDHKTSLSMIDIMTGSSEGDVFRAHCPSCALSMPWVGSITEAIHSWAVCLRALQTKDGTPIKDLTVEHLAALPEDFDPTCN